MPCNCPVRIDVNIAHCFDCVSLPLCGEPQFPEHFPTHPEQESASRKHQPQHLQQLGGGCGERYPQDRRSDDPHQDSFRALLQW